MLLDDAEDALRRLEESGPGLVNPVRHATTAHDVRALARMWVAERGWKRGEHLSPSPGVLAVSFQRWLDARGVDVRATATLLSGELRRRFRMTHSGGVRGYLMREEDARELWLLAEEVAPHVVARRRKRRPRRQGGLVVRQRPPFHPVHVHATPIISSAGEVFPTFKVAAALLRVADRTVNMAARRGHAAAGRLWRYLTPAEVALVPADARAGDRVPALLGHGTVSVRCGHCGMDTTPATPLPGFPPPPGGAKAGGP